MTLEFHVQVLLLTGLGLTTIIDAALWNKSALISSRAMKSSSCEPIYPTIPSCGSEPYVFHFRYNQRTTRCEDFITCESSTDGFPSREICLLTCNKESTCLKIGWRPGGGIKPWYHYDSEEDDCIEETDSSASSSDVFPVLNVFRSAKECRVECMPTYDQWG
ncbi:uncharacterized protein LOC125940339 [Dermacentor silvarum]|uniref:uncharacterized protein LOC125940339 n=1 Tax=Dermacentor silvarum TaxID=543639 RepID=UPI0021008E71|nr:uncharacterized protein LOC125940339 [Dermacentor silvarum]